MSFNKSQKQAINVKKGPTLILAGPGSGKTTVITEHTKYLLEENITNEENIMVVTFTNNSAKEMKERFNNLTNNKYPKVTFGTFHHIYYQIVKISNPKEQRTLIDPSDRNTLLKDIVKKLGVEMKDEKDFLQKIGTDISVAKCSLEPIENFKPTSCSEDNFILVYNEYQKILYNSMLIDYDDMLLLCYELITKNNEVLKQWQEKFKYILVDEFQDTNKIQFEILKLLALPENNLFIVGDDDQSIYKFRGAKPEIMLSFKELYPKAKIINLDVNYRSTPQIVEGATIVINNNKTRYEKNLKAKKRTGEKIYINTQTNQYMEMNDIVKKIQENVALGIPKNEIAIIYRSNLQTRVLTEILMKNDIKFYIKDGVSNIYEHWVAKDIFAYIQLGMGKPEYIYLPKILNKPTRYIENKCLRKLSSVTIDNIIDYYENVTGQDWMVEHLITLKNHLKTLKSIKKPIELLEYIYEKIGYIDYLKDQSSKNNDDIDELLYITEDLKNTAKDYNTCEEWIDYIVNYSNELNDVRKNNKKDYDSINLLTMHAAKGLEYEVVFIIDANETIIPNAKAIQDNDIEEERRVFYVAMTRAKQRLYIYSIREKNGKDIALSRFVKELQSGLKKKAIQDENDKIIQEMKNAQKTIDKLTLNEKDEIYELINDVPKPLEDIKVKDGILIEKQIYHPTFEYGFIQKEENEKLHIYFIKKDKIIVLDKKICDMLSLLHYF